jgi:hypothetical protein
MPSIENGGEVKKLPAAEEHRQGTWEFFKGNLTDRRYTLYWPLYLFL